MSEGPKKLFFLTQTCHVPEIYRPLKEIIPRHASSRDKRGIRIPLFPIKYKISAYVWTVKVLRESVE